MYTRVEENLDISDTSRLWYTIPGYNGYELSNDGIVRSMKHHKKYPYGILIKPVMDNRFVLTNSNNKRVTISIDEMKELISKDEYSKSYPRHTSDLYKASRNQKCTIVQEPKQMSKELHHPKFTIIGGK